MSTNQPINNKNGGPSYSGINSPQENEKLTDNNRLLPMDTKASSADSSYICEYGKKFLPPAWVDHQEDIERFIEEIYVKCKSFSS